MSTNKKLTREEVAEIFRSLRALKQSSGFKPNKDERTAALIGACIFKEFNTEAQIVGALTRLEVNPPNIKQVLYRHTGVDPERHMWKLGVDNRYQRLPK